MRVPQITFLKRGPFLRDFMNYADHAIAIRADGATIIAGHDLARTLARVNSPILEAVITEEDEDHTASIILSRCPALDAHIIITPRHSLRDPLGRAMEAGSLQDYFLRYERRIQRLTSGRLSWERVPAVPPEARRYAHLAGGSMYDILAGYRPTGPVTSIITFR